MEKTIRRENIEFTIEPFEKIIISVLNKYNVQLLDKETVDLDRNLINITVVIGLPEQRTTSSTGLMTILQNEIMERIMFFSSIKVNSIQIVLGAND